MLTFASPACSSRKRRVARATTRPSALGVATSLKGSQYPKWPAFCSRRCAVQYAVDHVQEELDQDELHECIVAGEWVRAPMHNCPRCDPSEYIGREDDDPGPDVEKRKARKKKRRAPPRG